MNTRRIVVSVVVGALIVSTFSALIAAPAAQAQVQDQERLVTCAAYNVAVSTGGQAAATAAEELRVLGAPNPPGIENALDILVEAESNVSPTGDRPPPDAIERAHQALNDYFGAICERTLTDTCRLVTSAVAEAGSSDSAALLRRLETPAPPGIDAALAVLSGEITAGESPFHATIDQAIAQVQSYYPCTVLQGAGPVGVEICAALGRVLYGGGPGVLNGVASLRVLTSPNPAAVEAALDTIIDAEDGGTVPSGAAVGRAEQIVVGYFADSCSSVDTCALVNQAVATNDGSSAEAAALLRGITAPAPPGIDAALALIAEEVTASPFHASVAEAQAQIASYFPCGTVAPGSTPVATLELCADLSVIGIPEGPLAAAAAERIRAAGSPNPPGIENALDVIVAFAEGTTTEPSLGDVDAAFLTLQNYFGGVCSNIDRCPLVLRAVGSNPSDAAVAAELLWRLETPAPPGIGAALALIGGVIDESPFHSSVAEAQAQIDSYYSCSGLAFTGPSSAGPLASLGAGLLAAGTVALVARRRVSLAT